MGKKQGYTGISFPFRVGPRGGISMSTTKRYNMAHIEESIEQILRTRVQERVMELYFGSELDLQLFEPNDPTTHNFIAMEIVEALEELEERVEISRNDIRIWGEDNIVKIELKYEVEKFQKVHKQIVEMAERGEI